MTSRYTAAAHRVQTAIAFLMGRDTGYSGTDPKHMRVGIDMTKADMGALATLLIAKGVFTEEEYVEMVTQGAEREAASYEAQVQAVIGNRKVHLG